MTEDLLRKRVVLSKRADAHPEAIDLQKGGAESCAGC
jgi:hypothetical protein